MAVEAVVTAGDVACPKPLPKAGGLLELDLPKETVAPNGVAVGAAVLPPFWVDPKTILEPAWLAVDDVPNNDVETAVDVTATEVGAATGAPKLKVGPLAAVNVDDVTAATVCPSPNPVLAAVLEMELTVDGTAIETVGCACELNWSFGASVEVVVLVLPVSDCMLKVLVAPTALLAAVAPNASVGVDDVVGVAAASEIALLTFAELKVDGN